MELRIGLIGLDTSHVVAFSKVLNDPAYAGHVAGGQVVVAYPGGSADIPLSASRVGGFTAELNTKYGVRIVDSPEAVAEACDLVFIESIDGRVHLEQLRRTARYRRPTFVDKPLAHDSSEAIEMFRIAREGSFPLMSASSIRYAGPLTEALHDQQAGAIVGCDAFGPVDELPMPPGLFWYGIHTAEAIYRVMGTGCVEVRATRQADGEIVVGTWADGRLATLRGLRKAHHHFGMTIHRDKGFQQLDLDSGKRPAYDLLLEAIMGSLPKGTSAIAESETLEVIRFLEAANESRLDGRAVRL
jgi:predicted dehydrogenase